MPARVVFVPWLPRIFGHLILAQSLLPTDPTAGTDRDCRSYASDGNSRHSGERGCRIRNVESQQPVVDAYWLTRMDRVLCSSYSHAGLSKLLGIHLPSAWFVSHRCGSSISSHECKLQKYASNILGYSDHIQMYVVSTMPLERQAIAGSLLQTMTRLVMSLGLSVQTAAFSALSGGGSTLTREAHPFKGPWWVALAVCCLGTMVVPFVKLGKQGQKIKSEATD